MSQKDDEFRRLVERYVKNYRRLRRLISIQKTKPGHKPERKVYEAVVPRIKRPALNLRDNGHYLGGLGNAEVYGMQCFSVRLPEQGLCAWRHCGVA